MPKGKGAPQPPARLKRNSQVEVSKGILFHSSVGSENNWPNVMYRSLAICPTKQAISIMGLKLTWFAEFQANAGVPVRVFANMGLIRLSDLEVEAADNNNFEKVDQRLARRVFGKQTTVVARAGNSATNTSGPDFAAMVQTKQKGIITLTAGQGLFVAGFFMGDVVAPQRYINYLAEWSQTARTSEAFTQ